MMKKINFTVKVIRTREKKLIFRWDLFYNMKANPRT